MKKGWVRFVSGSYGEICSLDKLNDRQLGVILNIMEDDGIIGDASGFYTKEVNLEYYMARDEERHPEIVNVKYYGSLENSEIKNLIKGKPRSKLRSVAQWRCSVVSPLRFHTRRKWTSLPIKKRGRTVWPKTSSTWLTNRTVHGVSRLQKVILICYQTRLIGLLLTPMMFQLRCSSILSSSVQWSEDDWSVLMDPRREEDDDQQNCEDVTQGQLRRDEWTHRSHHDHRKGVPYVGWGICSKTPIPVKIRMGR